MYQKNFKPKNRQAVAGANDHLWISEAMKQPTDRKKYEENYRRIFGHD